MAIVMAVSLFACFAVNTSAVGVTVKDSKVFNVPKTSTAPKLDGNVDSSYKQIYKMKGSDCLKKDGSWNESFPLDGNRNNLRYDAEEHPQREQSDWWNCTMTVYAAWDATYLYLLVDITNAGPLDNNPNANWAGDGLQVAVFKIASDSGSTTDYTIAQDNGKIVAAMNLGNTLGSALNQKKNAYDSNKYGRAPSGFIKVSDKTKGNYTYELALEWTALGVKPSDKINFNCSVNLNDEDMLPEAFCGFQLSNGIFNETDQKTKSGMAYAASMIFEGEGGNASSSSGNGNSGGNSGGTTTPTTPTTPETPTTPDTPTTPETPTVEESEVVKAARTAFAATETKMAELESNTSYDETQKADVVAAFEEFKAALNAETIDETALAAAQKAFEDAYAALTGTPAPEDKKDNDKKENDKNDDNKQKEPEKGGNLTWLWIVIAVVVVLAAAFCIVYFVVCKGDMNKFKALFSKKK